MANRIKILSEPEQTTYTVCDVIELDGAYIGIEYDDGTEQKVKMSYDMLSRLYFNSTGTYAITVTYAGMTANFSVNVFDAEDEFFVTSIKISALPTKTKYQVGEEFDVTQFSNDNSFLRLSFSPQRLSKLPLCAFSPLVMTG